MTLLQWPMHSKGRMPRRARRRQSFADWIQARRYPRSGKIRRPTLPSTKQSLRARLYQRGARLGCRNNPDSELRGGREARTSAKRRLHQQTAAIGDFPLRPLMFRFVRYRTAARVAYGQVRCWANLKGGNREAIRGGSLGGGAMGI